MNIKEFKPGQEAYIVDLDKGSNVPPSIHQTYVTKVGREYVTTSYYSRRYRSSSIPYGLEEQVQWGNITYLCPDRNRAEMYIEHENLQKWLYKAAALGNKYTLDQLRQVKEILEVEDD